jgi:hypothetical protein
MNWRVSSEMAALSFGLKNTTNSFTTSKTRL